MSTLLTAVGIVAAGALGIAGGPIMGSSRLGSWMSHRPPDEADHR
jgi:hypothetical protein